MEKTHRHYLSVSLVLGVILLQVRTAASQCLRGLPSLDGLHNTNGLQAQSMLRCHNAERYVFQPQLRHVGVVLTSWRMVWCDVGYVPDIPCLHHFLANILAAVFMRALTLHLQICWQVITGRKFFIGAQLAGWGIPAIFVALALSITGVSYRFGNTCHINHAHGLEDFWGPLLAVAGATMIIQLAT